MFIKVWLHYKAVADVFGHEFVAPEKAIKS